MEFANKARVARISFLADALVQYRRSYYQGTPLISDADYDLLEDELRLLDPEHPLLAQIGSSPLEASDAPKVPHQVPMLSLAKTYLFDELLSWAAGRKLVGTLKIDGVSLSLIYRDGQLVCAKTRGNGVLGEDVSEKARWINDCLRSLHHAKMPEALRSLSYNCEVRGELYCSHAQFALLLQEMHKLGLPAPSNPRNIVAGILGRKQHQQLARFFNFYAFEVLNPAGGLPLKSEHEKLLFLAQLGFELPFFAIVRSSEEIKEFLAQVQEKMSDGDHGIDGAVFILDELAQHASLGATSHHPRYKMAFKWQGETAVAQIVAITWNTSRLGVVTPVANIAPVQLSGATITRVTLHNAAHVQALGLQVGDTIKLVRSGEVIPKFLEKLSSADGMVELPKSCTACGGSLHFDGVRLLCLNETGCPAQQIGRILNWIRAVSIDDLSEKRLQALMAAGLVTRIADLYRLSKADLLTLPLTKERMAAKLLANIARSRQVDLAAFLQGLGIKGIGRRSWQDLLQHYPDLVTLQQLDEHKITAISGFAEKTAQQIVLGLAANEATIAELLAVGVQPSSSRDEPLAAAQPWAGKHFAITGTLSRGRKEIAAEIEALGGRVVGQVSAQTYALIIADPESSSEKAVKARSLGIRLWNEADLQREIAALT